MNAEFRVTSRPRRPLLPMLPCHGVDRQVEDGTASLLSVVPCGTLEFRGHSSAGVAAMQGLVLRAFRARALSVVLASLILGVSRLVSTSTLGIRPSYF